MNDPSRVRVSGPLGLYTSGFRAELEAQGYSPGTVAVKLQLVAELSRWLSAHDLEVGDLTSARIEEFFEVRRARVRVLFVSSRALQALVDYLDRVGVLPPPRLVEPTWLESFLERYSGYLLAERALGERTVTRYVYVAGRFLRWCGSGDDPEFVHVTAGTATKFVTVECTTRSRGWAKAVVVALRCLLRYLYLEGLIPMPLAQAVPTPAGWANSALPKALKPSEVAALMAACDRRSVAGRRDYAVLVVLSRLGLRAGEVAGLQLTDIDWRAGEIRVRGKGPRVDVLPLPADVGRALAGYTTGGRPRAGGAVFRRIGAPHGPIAAVTVTGIVYRGL